MKHRQTGSGLGLKFAAPAVGLKVGNRREPAYQRLAGTGLAGLGGVSVLRGVALPAIIRS
jgi:hypothetical protein